MTSANYVKDTIIRSVFPKKEFTLFLPFSLSPSLSHSFVSIRSPPVFKMIGGKTGGMQGWWTKLGHWSFIHITQPFIRFVNRSAFELVVFFSTFSKILPCAAHGQLTFLFSPNSGLIIANEFFLPLSFDWKN